jgi:hypothetical protein
MALILGWHLMGGHEMMQLNGVQMVQEQFAKESKKGKRV